MKLITSGKITTETLRSDYARNYISRTGKIIVCHSCSKSRYLPKNFSICRSCASKRGKVNLPLFLKDVMEAREWSRQPYPDGGAV